jgi:hypothetical protein
MPEVQKIQWRRGTAAAWTAANPVLSEGTPGFETDTGKFKVGDGTKDWKTLGYKGDVTLDGTQVLTNKTLTSPRVNQLLDTNGVVSLVCVAAHANGVNYLSVSNNATGLAPKLAASGSDPNININLMPKGPTGNVTISGPLDAPMHTLLTGLYNAGSRSSFIYGPGGSVAGEVRLAGSLNVASIGYSSSASGRVDFSASLQITGAVTAGTF